ncbi:hypothetical protein HGRIS_009706 [Hohenbuehelia grisea]|uniref:Uncharacterized protein n=1 Tax=Hohenbuehelia grisea TaxID=104357 RepID=A0ABR3J248_9AGAR
MSSSPPPVAPTPTTPSMSGAPGFDSLASPPHSLSQLSVPYIAGAGSYPPALMFIVSYHRAAITALSKGTSPNVPPIVFEEVRAASKDLLASYGFQWPEILDQSFPPADPEAERGAGLVYETAHIDGKPYLKLTSSNARPTPLQVFALKVLTYTFPLLALRTFLPPENTRLPSSAPRSNVPPTIRRIQIPIDANQVHIPPNVNNLLQEMGLPQIRLPNQPNAPNPNLPGIMADLRRIPFRPLFAPLLMLLFRTVLLLYFVAPARKPVFAVLLLAWVFYECWQAVRNTLGRGLRRGAAPGAAVPVNANGAPAGAAAPPLALQPGMNFAGGQPGAAGVPNLLARPGVNGFEQQLSAFFGNMATLNIEQEEQALAAPNGVVPVEPGFGHKLMAFFALFFSTVHPAAWNKRRTALRQREGRIRMEASARRQEERDEGDPDSTAPELVEDRAFNQRRRALIDHHNRRPKWVRDYIERVLAEEWVDDAD